MFEHNNLVFVQTRFVRKGNKLKTPNAMLTLKSKDREMQVQILICQDVTRQCFEGKQLQTNTTCVVNMLKGWCILVASS